MFWYRAIFSSTLVSCASHAAFVCRENKTPKPALINEVQFHLAYPVVIVQCKMLPALPCRKTVGTFLLPIGMQDLHWPLSRFGCPDPRPGRQGNAFRPCLSPRSVPLF